MIPTVAVIIAQVAMFGATPLQDAQTWFAALQQGKLANAAQLNPDMAQSMTPDALTGMASMLKDTGTPKTFEQVQTSAVQSLTIYVFKITFANAPALNFIYTLDSSGKIAGLRFSPAE